MVPFYKYEVLYTRNSKGVEKRILVCLGRLSSNRRAIVTPETYAFRIFASQLELKDIEDTDKEFINSVKNYIGKIYSMEEFYEAFPDDDITWVGNINSSKYAVINTRTVGDSENKKSYIVRKYDAYRADEYEKMRFQYTHVGTNQLRIHYRIIDSF